MEITDLDGDAVGKVSGVEASDAGHYMDFYFFICQLLFMLFLLCFSYLFPVCLDFYVFFFFPFLDQGTVKTTKEGRVVVGWGERDNCRWVHNTL